ncbi:MAG: nicotinate (nicotinamide) nucleotide adenylyltransferase [Oscillospiraceae bacterium]
MIRNILLFGGTFDPVHNGHIALLQNAYNLVHPDLTLIIPSSLPPHKDAAKTQAAMRMEMCKALANAVPNARVDDIELLRNGRSYTVDTVAQLCQQYKGARFYFCVGSDMLLYFSHWKSWQTLLAAVTLVVQSRQDADMRAVQKEALRLVGLGGRILLAKEQPVEMSSTLLREMIYNNQDITNAVPPSVALLISQNNLYKNGE